MIIDAHTHMSFEKIIAREPISGLEIESHSADDQIKVMDSLSIDKAVVLTNIGKLPLLTPDQIRDHNTTQIKIAKKYPRLIPFALINHCLPEASDDLREAIRSGCRGVKLFCLPFIPIDSSNSYPFFETVRSLKIPVTFHTDFNEYYVSPYRMLNVAKQFPDITFLLAHMGYDHHQIWDFIRRDDVKTRDNLIMETAATPMIPLLIKKSCDLLGPERIVFGSEAHLFPPELGILKIKLAGLEKKNEQLVLGDNMARILGEE